MKRRAALLQPALVALLVLLGACYGTRQESRQVDAAAALVFTGDPSGCTATLVRDGVSVWSAREIAGGVRYKVGPGVYQLTVERNGTTVVRRQIYLGDQQDFEVRVPALR